MDIANSLEKMLDIININEQLSKLHKELYHTRSPRRDYLSRFRKKRELAQKRGQRKQSLRADIKKIRGEI